MKTRVLVVGATAGMVAETVRLFAVEGASLFLAARNEVRLASVAAAATSAGATTVHRRTFDAADLQSVRGLVAEAVSALGGLDAVLVAHGAMPDQERAEADPDALLRALNVNGTSAVLVMQEAAAYFEAERRGCLAVISSAAGVRGRRSTYVYGMAKGMVTACAQGLRARLHERGVSVVTVFPVFVATRMNEGLPRRVRWISAISAGRRIHRAMQRGTDQVFVPRIWQLAMFVARNLPESWVKRSKAEARFLEQMEAQRERSSGQPTD